MERGRRAMSNVNYVCPLHTRCTCGCVRGVGVLWVCCGCVNYVECGLRLC